MGGASVLILTLDEEINIADCIDSCRWSDDIVVFDSLSSDRTQEIARNKGARVIERRFDNYAAQRMAALREVEYRHDWVLMVDADERVPETLASEIMSAVATAGAAVTLFRMRRKDFYLGKWLRRSSGYPTWFGRLVRPHQVRVEREFNEEFLTEGTALHLREHLHHFPFNKGIAYWIERHNRYSNMEAAIVENIRDEALRPADLLSADPTVRRRALKRIAYRLPMRPWMVFFYLYIVRLGILDGRGGLEFSRMRATYEMLIDLKLMELERRKRGLPV